MNYLNSLGAFFASILLLTGCGNGADVSGKWVQPVPGMPEMEQGFLLQEGGQAASVNMATLQYETWERQGDRLILSGKSIGNHQTLSFRDTLIIERLTPDSLVVRKGNHVSTYAREEWNKNE